MYHSSRVLKGAGLCESTAGHVCLEQSYCKGSYTVSSHLSRTSNSNSAYTPMNHDHIETCKVNATSRTCTSMRRYLRRQLVLRPHINTRIGSDYKLRVRESSRAWGKLACS